MQRHPVGQFRAQILVVKAVSLEDSLPAAWKSHVQVTRERDQALKIRGCKRFEETTSRHPRDQLTLLLTLGCGG